MAGALNKAMEKIGWKSYESNEDFEDEYFDDASYETNLEPVTPMPRPEIVTSRSQDSDMSRIVTVHPTTYEDARTIGEAFRDGIPVIINLSNMKDSEAKRVTDFSAGLAFGLRGSIESVTSGVMLLSPESVKVEKGKEIRSQSRNPFL